MDRRDRTSSRVAMGMRCKARTVLCLPAILLHIATTCCFLGADSLDVGMLAAPLPPGSVQAVARERSRGCSCLPVAGAHRGMRTRRSSGGCESPNVSVGGARAQALLTAAVAGTSAFLLCNVHILFMNLFGLPLWRPPLGAAALIFASEATAAAQTGEILRGKAIFVRSVKTGSAVAGACLLAVTVTKVFGSTSLSRAMAVAVCSLFMSTFPLCGYFPPSAAFCVLFVDAGGSIGGSAIARLGWRYAFFPCAAGTVFLAVCSRILASAFAQPLRRFVAISA